MPHHLMRSQTVTTRPSPHPASVELSAQRCGPRLAKAFRPGDRALEIGCGTGVDACFLAERGVRVVACDISSQMIAVATRRVQENGLQKLVQPLVLRAEDIGTFATEELFDGAFSNFGALNCVEDLRRLARDLAKLLKPGATVLLCWMGSLLPVGNALVSCARQNRQGVPASASGWRHRHNRRWSHSSGSIIRPSVRWRARLLPNFG